MMSYVKIFVFTLPVATTSSDTFSHSLLQNGVSPVFIASCEGHTDVVDVLVKAGADVNKAKTTVRQTFYTNFASKHFLFTSHSIALIIVWQELVFS